MAKDNQAARDEQASSWRESIKELTKGKSNQKSENSATENESSKTERSTGGEQLEDTQSQPSGKESARDFIQRRMREERDKQKV